MSTATESTPDPIKQVADVTAASTPPMRVPEDYYVLPSRYTAGVESMIDCANCEEPMEMGSICASPSCGTVDYR